METRHRWHVNNACERHPIGRQALDAGSPVTRYPVRKHQTSMRLNRRYIGIGGRQTSVTYATIPLSFLTNLSATEGWIAPPTIPEKKADILKNWAGILATSNELRKDLKV